MFSVAGGQITYMPWRRGVVVIVSANTTEDRGFESRLGVRFLGHYIFEKYFTSISKKALLLLQRISVYRSSFSN
jgi:hypothetical protein